MIDFGASGATADVMRQTENGYRSTQTQLKAIFKARRLVDEPPLNRPRWAGEGDRRGRRGGDPGDECRG